MFTSGLNTYPEPLSLSLMQLYGQGLDFCSLIVPVQFKIRGVESIGWERMRCNLLSDFITLYFLI